MNSLNLRLSLLPPNKNLSLSIIPPSLLWLYYFLDKEKKHEIASYWGFFPLIPYSYWKFLLMLLWFFFFFCLCCFWLFVSHSLSAHFPSCCSSFFSKDLWEHTLQIFVFLLKSSGLVVECRSFGELLPVGAFNRVSWVSEAAGWTGFRVVCPATPGALVLNQVLSCIGGTWRMGRGMNNLNLDRAYGRHTLGFLAWAGRKQALLQPVDRETILKITISGEVVCAQLRFKKFAHEWELRKSERGAKPILSRGLGVIGRREMIWNLSCTKGKNYLQEDEWNMSLCTGWIGCEVWKGGRSIWDGVEGRWKDDRSRKMYGEGNRRWASVLGSPHLLN